MTQYARLVLLALMVAGLVAAGWSLRARVQAEGANRVVGIAVDYNRVQELATMRGETVAAALRKLRAAGATHAAIREDTLGDLIEQKQVRVVPQGRQVRVVPEAQVRERVLSQLEQRTPAARRQGDTVVFPDRAALDLMRDIGIGYAETAVADARAANLEVVARPVAEKAISPQALSASMDACQAAGARVVVFGGLQVWGAHDLIPWVAPEMQRRGLLFGYVEMARQIGDDKLAGALKSSIIRCHAIAQAEVPKVHPQRALERFSLAVQERNVRLCYVRPYDMGALDPLEAAVQFVGALAQDLCRAGYRTGSVEVFLPVKVGRLPLAVQLMGIGAGLIWVVQLIFGLRRRWFWAFVAADLVLSAAAAAVASSLAQAVGALGAATVFPTLGLLALQVREAGGRASLGRGVVLFLRVSAVSVVGGVLAAACISDLGHMMEVAVFRGVKLAQVVPLLVVWGVFASRGTVAYWQVRTESGAHAPEWPALREGFREVALGVVRYWHVVLLVIALAVAAVMLMRSGNVAPVPPSELELAVRSFLDRALLVRPRTKEILLGHPALILSLALLLAGWRRGLWAGMLLGAVGQVSLVNTFGHIHTPLWVSLMRVGNGLWVGIAVACVLALLRALVLRFMPCPILDSQGRLRAIK